MGPSSEKVAGFGDGSDRVIGACIEVHRHLGPGLLEAVYHRCLCQELGLQGLRFESEVSVPLTYKGTPLQLGYRLDLVVERHVVVEVKAVEKLLPVHEA